MSKKQKYTVPPQQSAEDTSNWDDRAFAILRPNSDRNGKPLPSLAVMRPDIENSPFSEEDTEVKKNKSSNQE